MASPKMLVLREQLAGLGPRHVYLNRPREAKRALPGEFADLTRQAAAQARNRRRGRQIASQQANDSARGFERSIPVSGPNRRRAKAARNDAAAGD
ncbi:MAG TPA: hypothetical protein VN088_19125 [Nocardioides sp.]|nr:hypothetical protein [Nocardioides sp.]